MYTHEVSTYVVICVAKYQYMYEKTTAMYTQTTFEAQESGSSCSKMACFFARKKFLRGRGAIGHCFLKKVGYYFLTFFENFRGWATFGGGQSLRGRFVPHSRKAERLLT